MMSNSSIPSAAVHAGRQSRANLIGINEPPRSAARMMLPNANVDRPMLNEVMDFAGEVLPGTHAVPPYSETAFLAELGERLKSSRARCELSRRELSRRSGISELYIAQIEAG
jgi:XRE family aerobic/anaerobic benzoate catabolism transcriptional regulator